MVISWTPERWHHTCEHATSQRNTRGTRIAQDKFIPGWYQARNKGSQQDQKSESEGEFNFKFPDAIILWKPQEKNPTGIFCLKISGSEPTSVLKANLQLQFIGTSGKMCIFGMAQYFWETGKHNSSVNIMAMKNFCI